MKMNKKHIYIDRSSNNDIIILEDKFYSTPLHNA
jgi:hypothetical protein